MRIQIIKKVHRKLRYEINKLKSWIYIKFPLGEKYYILGTPTHPNVGDSAIALAETLFIRRTIGWRFPIKELTNSEVLQYSHYINPNHNHLFWHGGGNMGDYYNEENYRRQFINKVSSKLVIFPQTFFYSDTETGNKELVASIDIYNSNSITIVAREKYSFERMKEMYPKARVILTPDIVLSSTCNDYGVSIVERSGVLFVTRTDLEKSIDDNTWEELKSKISQQGICYSVTDMYSKTPVTKENRAVIVREKMQEFCKAQLVITDRLHGMVFAALTDTPCVAFGNFNSKVKGTYEWINYLPYIRYVETLKEALEIIPKLLNMQNNQFCADPLILSFDELTNIIKEG